MLAHTSGTIGADRTYADFIEHVAPVRQDRGLTQASTGRVRCD
jgi:hypothetical protein